jgi:alpha-tubulin suppressor-like RCC1 family protein
VEGISTATAIAAGDSQSCAVLGDGTLKCWGYNSYGRLGDGTETNSAIPVSVNGISSAVAAAVGLSHRCALLSDGTVRCWGLNVEGQLGSGEFTFSSPIPVNVGGLTAVTAISAGWDFTLALRSDGTVKGWGSNISGVLTGGYYTTPISVEFEEQ